MAVFTRPLCVSHSDFCSCASPQGSSRVQHGPLYTHHVMVKRSALSSYNATTLQRFIHAAEKSSGHHLHFQYHLCPREKRGDVCSLCIHSSKRHEMAMPFKQIQCSYLHIFSSLLHSGEHYPFSFWYNRQGLCYQSCC